MSFLAPTSALIAAALVVPALVVMYLLKLRRRPLRVSSTMLWPDAATDVQVNVPLAPPRPSWLMLLHVLIGAALIVAAGRPVLLKAGGHAGRVLLVIDRSASMSAMDGANGAGIGIGVRAGGERITRLDEAKQKARALIGAASSGTEFAVISVAAGAEIAREFSADSAGATAVVDRLQPTDQPGDLASAMEVARAMLSGAGLAEEDGGAEILVLSDGAFAEGTRAIEAPGGVVRLVRCGPAPGADKSNLGIVVLSARRDAQSPDVVHLFGKVLNAGFEARVVPVRLSIDGAAIQTRSVTVPGSSGGVPGEIGVVLSASVPAGGLAMMTLLVDDERDLLASDNSASTNLRSAAPVRVLLVQRGAAARSAGEPGSSISADFLLADALAEIGARELAPVGAARYEEMARAGDLKFFDLIVFDGVTPREVPVLPSLSFGAGMPGLELGPSRADGEAKPIQSWVRSSPFLRDITLDGVVVAHERGFLGKATDVLARGERGPLIVASGGNDRPKRLLVTFALENSNWSLQAGFPIFLKTAADLLTSKGDTDAGVQFRTVQPVFFSGVGEPPEFVGPREVAARLVAGTEPGSGEVRRMTLGVLDRAGVYTARAVSGFPPIAVNLLDAHESGVGTSDVLRVGSRIVSTGGAIARPMEVWWWALVIAAALLAIEWIVFARSARL
ncbi:MAG: BatA and WFA domain-containing protein [Planctomycetes bacterium]|nr:BatA and WFA domain-containing protein [Planctomycetota bacterium]